MTSAEGTTQRDPLAMSLYAISLQQLITRLNSSSLTKQIWYADDAAGAGPLRKWWDVLNKMGKESKKVIINIKKLKKLKNLKKVKNIKNFN